MKAGTTEASASISEAYVAGASCAKAAPLLEEL